MEKDFYKAIEINSLDQLKKKENFNPVTEFKQDSVILAKMWFYGKTCYFIPFRSKGKHW